METEKVGLFEAIYTQRAIRSLKPEPIPDDVLAKIVEAGTKAPSGGNSQPWAFVIVKDQKSISKIYPKHLSEKCVCIYIYIYIANLSRKSITKIYLKNI